MFFRVIGLYGVATCVLMGAVTVIDSITSGHPLVALLALGFAFCGWLNLQIAYRA